MSTSGKRNVACPHCATQLALDFSMAPGTAVMCPVCQQTLLVPDWGAAAVPEPVAEITIVPAAGSAGAAAVGAGAGAAPADAPLQAAAPPAAASPAADSASAASEPAAAASSGPSGAAPAPVAASPASDAAAAAAPRSPPEHKRTGVAADSAASAASLSAAGAGPPVTSSRSPLLERKRGSIMSVQGHTFTPLRGPAPKPGSPESKVSPTAPADGKATPDGGAGKVVAGADGKQQHSHAHVHVDWKTVLSDQQVCLGVCVEGMAICPTAILVVTLYVSRPLLLHACLLSLNLPAFRVACPSCALCHVRLPSAARSLRSSTRTATAPSPPRSSRQS